MSGCPRIKCPMCRCRNWENNEMGGGHILFTHFTDVKVVMWDLYHNAHMIL